MRLQVTFVAVAALSASAAVTALTGQMQEAASRIARRQLSEIDQKTRNPDAAAPSLITRRQLSEIEQKTRNPDVAAPSFITRRQLSTDEQGVEEALDGVTRNSSVQVSQGFDDFVKNGLSFSEIDFTSSVNNPDEQNPLAFALDFFRVAIPGNVTDEGFQRLSTDLDLYIAFETELRETGAGGTRFLTETKVVKFFLQFQKARVQTAKGQEVTLPGGVEHQREKVASNAKAIGVPEADLQALEDIPVPGAAEGGTPQA